MSLYNYVMKSATIGQIPTGKGKANEGMYYVVAGLKNEKNRREQVTRVTVFQNDDPEFVNAVRSVFPASGTDQNNNPWNGTSTEVTSTDFSMAEAMKKLKNLDGEDYTIFVDAKNFDCPLPGKYVMTYATNLAGHQAGEPIKEKNSSFVKVVTSVEIFVMMYDEAKDQYVKGWGPEDRLRSRMNNLIPLEEFIKDPANRAMVNPRDLGEKVSVPNDGEQEEDEMI